MRRSFGGYVLLGTGFLLCPCHLPLVVPLLVVLFGGTALGTWLSSNTMLVYALAGGYFIAALAGGFWLLNRRGHSEHSSTEEHVTCQNEACENSPRSSIPLPSSE